MAKDENKVLKTAKMGLVHAMKSYAQILVGMSHAAVDISRIAGKGIANIFTRPAEHFSREVRDEILGGRKHHSHEAKHDPNSGYHHKASEKDEKEEVASTQEHEPPSQPPRP